MALHKNHIGQMPYRQPESMSGHKPKKKARIVLRTDRRGYRMRRRSSYS